MVWSFGGNRQYTGYFLLNEILGKCGTGALFVFGEYTYMIEHIL
jgi:hypothetical protein